MIKLLKPCQRNAAKLQTTGDLRKMVAARAEPSGDNSQSKPKAKGNVEFF